MNRKWTFARFALLDMTWPAGLPKEIILDMLNQLPGAPVSGESLKFHASSRKLKRPAWFVKQAQINGALKREAEKRAARVARSIAFIQPRPQPVPAPPVMPAPVLRSGAPFSMLGGRIR